MRIFLIIILTTCSTIFAQEYGINDSLESILKTDAETLALREIIFYQYPNKDSVSIDLSLVDRYFTYLVQVNNYSNNSKRTIPINKIRARMKYPINHFLLFVGDYSFWIQRWIDGEEKTHIKAIDSLMSAYSLKVAKVEKAMNWYMVRIESEKSINVKALSKKFISLPDIENAIPNASMGGGNDIVARKTQDGVQLRYHYKWGDCPSGCIYDHYWKFHFNNDGELTYLGEFGDSIP